MAGFKVYTAEEAVEHLRQHGLLTEAALIVMFLLALDIIEAEGGFADFSPNEFIAACAGVAAAEGTAGLPN